MNIFKTTGFAIVFSVFTVSSALAASPVQKAEPANGFTKGENVEWSVITTGSKEFDIAHRAYQKKAEAERLEWLKTNKVGMGTPAYRQYVRQRNFRHRQWIMEQAGWMKSDGPLNFRIPTIFSTEFSITIIDIPMVNVTEGRVLSGPAPSRRSLILATEVRQKMHAQSIGQQ